MDIFTLIAKGEEAEKKQLDEETQYDLEIKQSKVKKLSPFDFLKSIYTKNYVLDEENEAQYIAFMVNRGMSNGVDTVAHAYQMDQLGSRLPREMQYDYYFYSVRKGVRYNSWAKEPKYESIDIIMEVYELSKTKAIDVLDRLSTDDLELLVTWFDSRMGGLTR